MKNFGPVLREARTNKGLTQADIAKHLNFDHALASLHEPQAKNYQPRADDNA